MEMNQVEQVAEQVATDAPAPEKVDQHEADKPEVKVEGEQQAEQEEPEDPAARAQWMKKKLRNLERANTRLNRKLGAYEQQLQDRLQSRAVDDINQPDEDDSEPVSLSRKELAALVEREAKKLAPQLSKQESVIEQRKRVAEGLVKDLGQERFTALTDDLDNALDGMEASKGRLKPAVEALLKVPNTRQVMEFLTDPDNEAQALAIGRMEDPVDAAFAIRELSMSLSAKKSDDKPQPSKAGAPIEMERGRGTVKTEAPSDMSQYMAWANKQYTRR
jgi:hypothetical protein